MNQLEQDILYLYDIQNRLFDMTKEMPGTYDQTELEKEKRAMVYRTSEKVAKLIFNLKNLEKLLRREEIIL